MQAVDAAGNVGRVFDKNIGFAGTPPPTNDEQPPGAAGLTYEVTGGGTTRQVELSGAAGVTIDYSLDGSAFQRYTTPFTVSGDGLHRVDARGSDRSELTVFVSIDSAGPGITIVTPPNGAVYLLGQIVRSLFYCTDAVGVASCSGPALVDTSTVTPTTRAFTVTARDTAGRITTKTNNYRVIYNFSGFFSPIMNPPTFNTVKAGSTVSIKFSLAGNQGLNVFASGYPLSRTIKCGTGGGGGKNEVVPPGNSTLSYSATTDQYQLGWKTDSRWAGTCRELVVRLRDGTDHLARFNFAR